MSKIDIQIDLDNLGEKVSMLAEENRQCKIRDNAFQILLLQLKDFLSPLDWVKIYESIDDIFVKDLMWEYGTHLFPKDFKK